MLGLPTGERFVSFNGIAKAAAKAMNLPEPEILNYNAKDFDFGKEKAFPLRDQHFFTSIDKVRCDAVLVCLRVLCVSCDASCRACCLCL